MDSSNEPSVELSPLFGINNERIFSLMAVSYSDSESIPIRVVSVAKAVPYSNGTT